MSSNAPHTSFIPKQNLSRGAEKRSHSRGMGVLTLITLIIFLAAVAAAAGMFLYQQYLERSIADKEESLERARSAFDPALIKKLQRTDARLSAASTLLSQHTALSELFTFLEGSTLEGVQFTEFDYTADGANGTSLSMKGRAESYSAVALQSDVFGESAAIRNSVFSNLNPDERGDILFDFAAAVQPSLISYSPQDRSGTQTRSGTSTSDAAPAPQAGGGDAPSGDSDPFAPQ